MVGHSFGLVSAVYNYNRRSAINEFLVKLFGLVAFSFYDDKYGFEPRSTAESVRRVAENVHFGWGRSLIRRDFSYRVPRLSWALRTIEKMQLEIKPEMKEELTTEIDAILRSGLWDPGSAG